MIFLPLIIADDTVVEDPVADAVDAVDPFLEIHEADHIQEMFDEIFHKATEVTHFAFSSVANSFNHLIFFPRIFLLTLGFFLNFCCNHYLRFFLRSHILFHIYFLNLLN